MLLWSKVTGSLWQSRICRFLMVIIGGRLMGRGVEVVGVESGVAVSGASGGAETPAWFAIGFWGKDCLLGKVLINFSLLHRPMIKVFLIAKKPLSCCITIRTYFLQIPSLLLLSRLTAITSILYSYRICCCTLLWLLYIMLLELVGVLLEWSTLNLPFSEFFPRPDATSRHSLYRHWPLKILIRIIVSIEIVEEQVSVLRVGVQVIDYFFFFIDSDANTTIGGERIVFGVEVFAFWSYF